VQRKHNYQLEGGAFAFSQFKADCKATSAHDPEGLYDADNSYTVCTDNYNLCNIQDETGKKEREVQPINGPEDLTIKQTSESKKDQIMKYLLIFAGIAFILIASFWIVAKM